jgi:L-ascorbate metabolism protein UlaG (beta-lactamase superfamily)
MTLTYYGHSCFKLDFGGAGSALFDPYERGSVPGIELPESLSADAVFISHNPRDHNAAGRVRPGGGKPGFRVEKIESFHDGERGLKRGKNIIHILSLGGFRAAHFGDLGCLPTEKELERLAGLDLALIPVGGFFTIDRVQAKRIVDAIRPRATVPMHYRRGGTGFDALGTVEDFAAQFPPELVHFCGSALEMAGGESGVYVMSV